MGGKSLFTRADIPFASPGTGSNLGYLINVKNSMGSHPIANLNELKDQFLTPISSSFTKFLEKFVDPAERTIMYSDEAKFNIEIEALNGPIDIPLWLEEDEELAKMYQAQIFKDYASQ